MSWEIRMMFNMELVGVILFLILWCYGYWNMLMLIFYEECGNCYKFE